MSIPADRHLRALIVHHAVTIMTERDRKNEESKKEFLAGNLASRFLDGSVMGDFRQAKEEVEKMIQTLRLAGEPNPYKEMSDDQIAKEIIRELAERKGVIVKV